MITFEASFAYNYICFKEHKAKTKFEHNLKPFSWADLGILSKVPNPIQDHLWDTGDPQTVAVRSTKYAWIRVKANLGVLSEVFHLADYVVSEKSRRLYLGFS